MSIGLIIFAVVCVYVIAKAIGDEGAKTRQLIRGQAADRKYQETIHSLNEYEHQLHAEDKEWKDKHLEAALERIKNKRAEAEAERQDAWDINQRGLAMERHLGLDPLSMLALDIARHETLSEWHAAGRSILREVPVRDRNCEDGWDITYEEWGLDIVKRQEEVRWEIAGLSSRKRAKRFEAAKDKSSIARAFYRARSIVCPMAAGRNCPGG